MESNHKLYDFEASLKRIDGYLDASSDLYEEVDEIPQRSKLSYSNGFYIKHCTALYVDVRGSSGLADKYKRPTLAKLYRSYISEVVALVNSIPQCSEVNIVGDAVYGIYNTPKKRDIDAVFSVAARISSIIDVINIKLKKRKLDPLVIGIGIDYGRLLMIQAGYSGSGLNEVVWMGNAVNGASNLCQFGNKTSSDREILVSSVVYSNLNDDNKKLLEYNSIRACYHGNVISVSMSEWVKENS